MNSVKRSVINEALNIILVNNNFISKIKDSGKKVSFLNDLQDYIYNRKGDLTNLENKLAFALGYNIVEG